jgi:hypothetical protein
MDVFKIEHFINTNNGAPFSWYHTLTLTESANLREKLRARLGLKATASDIEIVSALAARRRLVVGVSAVDREFNFIDIARAVSIGPNDIVYINWYRFDEVDQMRLADLGQYFDDVWYPSSDDIDVLDQDLSCAISVSHEGRVYTVDLPNAP